jgi:alpha-beta hydrolase superfamily lysophospholipase
MMNDNNRNDTDFTRIRSRRLRYGIDVDAYRLRVEEVLPRDGGVTALTLLVHGQTFPAGVGYDLAVPGYSLVEYLAARGVASCMFDHRGYGGSDKPTGCSPIGERERARDLEAVYGRLARRYPGVPITLVGLSSGCNTIARFLRESGTRPAAVVCISPCYLANPALRSLLKRARLIRFLRRLILRREDPYVGLGRRFLRFTLSDAPEKIAPQVLDRFIEDAISQQSPGSRRLRAPVLALAEGDRAPHRWEPLFDPGAIRCPLLVIHGDEDPLCCSRSAHALASDAGAPLAEVVTLEGRGHDPHLYRQHHDYFAALHRFVAPSLEAVG